MCATFGARLQALRKTKDWTQMMLSEKLGSTDPGTISAWEKDFHRPQSANLNRLAQVFEVPVGILVNLKNKTLCDTFGCPTNAPVEPASAVVLGDEPASPSGANSQSGSARGDQGADGKRAAPPRAFYFALMTLVALVLVVATTTMVKRRRAPSPAAELEFIYDDILREGGYIVLSNPEVFRYVNSGDRRVVDAHASSLMLRPVPETPRGPHLLLRSTTQYTGIGEALTAFHIQTLFGANGRASALEIIQSRGTRDGHRHMILLGGWGSNSLSTQLIGHSDRQKAWEAFHRRLPLRLHDGRAYRLAADGSESVACEPEYEVRQVDGDLIPAMECALLTKVREPFDNKVRLVAAGVNSQGTQAAGHLLTHDRARLLDWLRTTSRRPPASFQVLFRVPVDPHTGQPGTNYQLVQALALASEN